MKSIVFNLLLKEPLLATQPNSAEPNSSISYDYIPGGLIRGALAGQYVKKHNIANLVNDKTGYQLFLSGKVRYLNGYLCINQERLLPKPLSWFVEKGQEKEVGSKIYDFAVQDNLKQPERPKSPGGEFVQYSSGNVWLITPNKEVQVHNATTEPGVRRAGVSQVYRYDALAAGQTFQAVMLVDDEVDVTPLTQLLEQEYFVLGRSTTGGYGLVQITLTNKPSSWKEYTEETTSNDFYVVTCLSDLILRDENGHISAALDDVLGLQLEEVDAFKKLHLVGGFHNKWGLPLPQAMAIQAGSVFRIEKKVVPRKVLDDYVKKGIGERTIEGYGRIALNLHTQPTHVRIDPPKTAPEMPPELSSSYSKELAQTMAQRLLRQQLERQLTRTVLNHTKFTNLPSKTQLSRVRLAARQALAKEDLTLIANHMKSIKGAKNSWEKAKLNRKNLFQWIKRQSRLNHEKFTQLFNLTGELPTVADKASKIDEQLETEFRARLIDGVMKQAILQQQKEQDFNRRST